MPCDCHLVILLMSHASRCCRRARMRARAERELAGDTTPRPLPRGGHVPGLTPVLAIWPHSSLSGGSGERLCESREIVVKLSASRLISERSGAFIQASQPAVVCEERQNPSFSAIRLEIDKWKAWCVIPTATRTGTGVIH